MTTNHDLPAILPLGDTALIIRFADVVTPDIHRRVMNLVAHLDAHPIPGVLDIVPAFTSVTIHYDPLGVAPSHARIDNTSPYHVLHSRLEDLLSHVEEAEPPAGTLVEIPVCYGGEFGPDLEYVARHSGLDVDEVIALHSGTEYRLLMIGFLPGFPYLGGLPHQLATPRRATPRLRVPAGSVGIGGEQTGVYPLDSPGGWQIIGRTPLQLFLPHDDPPVLLHPGDRVRFRQVSCDE